VHPTKVEREARLLSAKLTGIERAPSEREVAVFDSCRISLLHLGGIPWARFGEHVGQRNLAVTANTYSHVLADETELDYAGLLERD
jgi:hypothetical protein